MSKTLYGNGLTSDGAVVTDDGGALTAVTGSTGQVLTSNGRRAPTFQAPAAIPPITFVLIDQAYGQTLTIEQTNGTVIQRKGQNSSVTDTLPSATLICAAYPVGTMVQFFYNNMPGNPTIALAVGAGGIQTPVSPLHGTNTYVWCYIVVTSSSTYDFTFK